MRPLALVTGASSGIGLSLTKVLGERGYDVVAVAEDAEVHHSPEVQASPGSGVVPVQADLATEAGVGTLHHRLTMMGQPVAVAALNAGVSVGGAFDQTALEDDLRLVDLNCRSVVHLAKLLVRDMVRAASGRLLLTSSIAAAVPGPYNATYAASKAFVRSFGHGIRHELRGTGVSLTVLLPGPTDTEIFVRGELQDTKLGRREDKDDPDQVASAAVDGLLAGEAEVVTGGLANKAAVAAGGALPPQLGAVAAARETRPPSQDFLG
jgi:short-subunit dehydrogenase